MESGPNIKYEEGCSSSLGTTVLVLSGTAVSAGHRCTP